MKKTIFNFAFVTGVLLMSCKQQQNKQETVQPTVSQNNAKVANGRIAFDEEYYRNLLEPTNAQARVAVENLDASADFTSILEYKTDANARKAYRSSATTVVGETDTTEYPEFLQNILNPDGVVQIGEYIFRINQKTEKVYALHQKHSNSYDDLLAENTTNTNILVFSTDQEVLNEIKQLNTGRTELLCFREGGASAGASTFIYNIPGTNLRQFGKIEYLKAGIYFSLVVATSVERQTLLLNWEPQLQPQENQLEFTYYGSYKPKCGSTRNVNLTSYPNGVNMNVIHNYRLYENAATALNSIDIYSKFKVNYFTPDIPYSPYINFRR